MMINNKKNNTKVSPLDLGKSAPSPGELNKASRVLGAMNSLMGLAKKLKRK